ncbi:MAG: polysaccharide deacetylase [Ruminococcaceae bacterium]|nr:polysaccharide deacetylase [Oscillospiraceae bacterium]
MYMKLKDGKSKVLTFSYDDGVVQDIRLVNIFNKYGLKATFNINSGCYLPEDVTREKLRGRLKRSEAIALYKDSGHEVAVHGLEHKFLSKLKPAEMVREVLEDRKNIEKDFGTITRGMAYAYSDYNAEAIEILKQCGIVYSRAVASTKSFHFPTDWWAIQPTCHHANESLMALAEKFVDTQSRYPSDNWLFYVWGHSYEFDDRDNWDVIERFAEYVSGKDDIWYTTNIEIHDYVRAYEALVVDAATTRVFNPTLIDVWFTENGKTYCVKAGETVVI